MIRALYVALLDGCGASAAPTRGAPSYGYSHDAASAVSVMRRAERGAA